MEKKSMQKRAIRRTLTVVAGGAVAMIPFLAVGTANAAPAPASVYVSPTGTPGADGTSCATAAYSVIDQAIEAVAEGGTVVVCPGTYQQTASADKTFALVGRRGAVINASGHPDGIVVTADDVTVRGLTIANATDVGILVTGNDATVTANTADDNGSVAPSGDSAGILVQGTAGSRIVGNTARDNGTGITLFDCAQCQAVSNTVTGSRVFGITLVSADNAVVDGNVVSRSQDAGIFVLASTGVHVTGNRATNSRFSGIFLSDGPGYNRNNVVSGNVAEDNGAGGITLTTGSDGGVNDNTIEGNTVKDNAGGGVELQDSKYGSSVRGNLIEGNRITGNSGPGVMVVHGYAVDISGNVIDMTGNVVTGNIIGTNNLSPDTSIVPVEQTTGIFVTSVTALPIQIASNVIYSDYFGVWTSSQVDASGLDTNHFGNVTVPVFSQS